MTSSGRGVARAGAGLLASLGAMAVLVGTLAGQESRLVGTWDVTGRLEDMPPEIAMTWTFESQDDGTVTGTWTGEAEGESYSRSADEIWVDGDAFGFTVSIVDQGETGVFTFEGALSKDDVSGTFHVHAEGMPQTLVGTFSGSKAEGTDAAPSR